MLNVTKKSTKARLHLIDELRGFWIVNMIIYHAIWDIIYIFGSGWNWFGADWVKLWQQIGCSSFICISGFCWQMSKKPFQRGMQVFLAGIVITVVTLVVMPSSRVVFGVLTLLGSCMLLMIPLDKVFSKINAWFGVMASLFLFFIVYLVNDGYLGVGPLRLVALPREWYANIFTTYFGFTEPGFFSTDYFSLLPWFFMFAQGYFLYSLLYKNTKNTIATKSIDVLGRSLCPFFGWIGRNSLIIYMLHQPVVYGVLYIVFYIIRS